MIDTEEYYGGTYPEPQEVIDCDIEDDDYDNWYADYYYEETKLGMID